ncbi:MAG: hypothetical protein QM751_00855 [Paludibacteraceae bacterium]
MKPLINGTPGMSHSTQAASPLFNGVIPVRRNAFTTDTEIKAANNQLINGLN